MHYERIDVSMVYDHLVWSLVMTIYVLVSIYAISSIWTDLKGEGANKHMWATFGLFLFWCVLCFMFYDMTERL